MVAEFGEEATKSAVDAFFDEESNLHSPEANEFAATLMKFIEVRREINKWWEENTYRRGSLIG